MKLSYILENYVVTAMSETVGFHIGDNDSINIHYVVEGLEYDQYFDDQEVQLDTNMRGAFTATDDDGQQSQFMALDTVDLFNRD